MTNFKRQSKILLDRLQYMKILRYNRSKFPFILGVAGVIGSGKSTLCKFLQDKYGFYWIEADEIVHELYKAGQPGYKKIKGYFGEQFVDPREVYRGRLRRLVLKNQHKFWILNKLIHPLVLHEVNKKIVQVKGAAEGLKICIEAFYFEKNDLGKFINQLVIVDASDEIILKRLYRGSKKYKKIPRDQLKILLKFQRKNLAPHGIRIRNKNTLENFYSEIAKKKFLR